MRFAPSRQRGARGYRPAFRFRLVAAPPRSSVGSSTQRVCQEILTSRPEWELLQRGDAVADGELDQARQILDFELLHHAASIGIDALGRQAQALGDLRARPALDDELQHLALARAQALDRIVLAALAEVALELLAVDFLAEVARAGAQRAHRAHHLAAGRLLDDVATRAGAKGLVDELRVGVHGEDQDLGSGADVVDLARDL